MAGTQRGCPSPGPALVAAMEPALEWREHPVSAKVTPCVEVPQWSPPWNGGNTARPVEVTVTPAWPQWSPPWNGGNTASQARSRCLQVVAAMEPALEWREHQDTRPSSSQVNRPQWSPPWNGGNTHRPIMIAALVSLAAMEPALEWREHRHPRMMRPAITPGRNGARLGMAGTPRTPRRSYRRTPGRNGARLGMAGTRGAAVQDQRPAHRRNGARLGMAGTPRCRCSGR